MGEYILSDRLLRREWIYKSPIHCVGFAFEDYLKERGYGEGTIHFYLACLAHFARSLTSKRIAIGKINSELCQYFITSHLPYCRCPAPRQLQVGNISAALKILQIVLVEQGFTSAEEQLTPASVEVEKFRHFLADVRGLAENTCQQRVKYVRQFLERNFGDGDIDVTQLSVGDVDEFILEFAIRWKPEGIGVIRTALKSYLQYRTLQGDHTERLVCAMPVLASRKGRPARAVLTEDQLKLFFASFDRADQTGQRDYAIARCIFDLGLRGHEVAQIGLNSIDWRNGTIKLSGTKARRVQVMPLPAITGQAVATYIRHARPKTTNRLLFVRHVAPWDKPVTVCTIRNAIKNAFARCGMDDQFHGTHILRHTMATKLYQTGASVKEIADVLRHKDLTSAATYVRTDIGQLQTVALPWPGRN
jgi:site-specific recombinase XerD